MSKDPYADYLKLTPNDIVNIEPKKKRKKRKKKTDTEMEEYLDKYLFEVGLRQKENSYTITLDDATESILCDWIQATQKNTTEFMSHNSL